MGEVFARGIDTAGNYHYSDTDGRHHIIPFQDAITNFRIPDKCKYCEYYYNFLCRANQCVNDGIVT